LGLVGETGAGKTTLARGIMGIIPNPPGEILGGRVIFEGRDLLKLGEAKMRAVRGNQISMIFQDPMTSLNPVMTVGEQIMEVIRTHNKLSPRETIVMARDMLEMVGISADRMGEYPHQFSGGMKQRVIIAIALACNPKLLIADEPTTALDVTIQAQVLEMIRSLKTKLNTSMLLITHDLGVVAQNCDHVAIIYAGEIVEYGSLRDIFKRAKHPYTQGLLGSIPSLAREVKRLKSIKGLMPDPTDLPEGCKFHTRCNYAGEKCAAAMPALTDIGEEHLVRCIYARGDFPSIGGIEGEGY
jgi:peptide/nickel transport system ATP-binding protein